MTPRPVDETARPTARVWTSDQIRALGVTTDIPTAGDILGLSRSHAYYLAQHDQFPVQVLRIGSRIRVPVAPLLTALGLPP